MDTVSISHVVGHRMLALIVQLHHTTCGWWSGHLTNRGCSISDTSRTFIEKEVSHAVFVGAHLEPHLGASDDGYVNSKG